MLNEISPRGIEYISKLWSLDGSPWLKQESVGYFVCSGGKCFKHFGVKLFPVKSTLFFFFYKKIISFVTIIFLLQSFFSFRKEAVSIMLYFYWFLYFFSIRFCVIGVNQFHVSMFFYIKIVRIFIWKIYYIKQIRYYGENPYKYRSFIIMIIYCCFFC